MSNSNKNSSTLIAQNIKLSPHVAVLIIEKLAEYGINSHDVLVGTGLQKEYLLSGENHISLKDMIALIENAVELAPEGGLGIRIGSAETISTMGVLGYALMSCATEYEAAEIGLRFQQTASSTMLIEGSEDQGRARIELKSMVPLGKALVFCVEENISGICATSSQYATEPVFPLEIHLNYPKPSYASLYEEYFNCPILYNQPHNVFWTRLPNDKPLQYTNPVSAKICINLVEQLVERYKNEEDLILQVRKILLRKPGFFPSMNYVAEELAVSPRTLHRKLEELDFSFSELVDDIRKDLAIDYLSQSNLTVTEISNFLGYSDESSFRRAFKKWTGKNPSHFR